MCLISVLHSLQTYILSFFTIFLATTDGSGGPPSHFPLSKRRFHSIVYLKVFLQPLLESSIVKWGYQDNFKTDFLFFFFTKRFRVHKKHQNAKQATFTFLELCARKKPLLFVFCSLIFVLLVTVCLWMFLHV